MRKKLKKISAAFLAAAVSCYFILGNISGTVMIAGAEENTVTGSGISSVISSSAPVQQTQPPAQNTVTDGSSGPASKSAADQKKERDKKKKIKKLRKAHVKGFKAVNRAGKSVILSWKKNKNAGKYYIYRSSGKSGKYKKIGKTGKSSYKDKKVSERSAYRYKVCASAVIGGKRYFGKKSDKKEVYIYPLHPKVVVSGECFGVAMQLYARNYFPKNTGFVVKAGMNTLQVLEKNCMSYNGRSVTPLERVALYKPDRVYMIYGANEAKGGNPYASMVNYSRMYDRLKKINSHVQFIIIGIPPFGWHSNLNIPSVSKRLAFNSEFKKLADKRDNIYYCSSSQLLADSTKHLQKKYDAGDGCHWNVSGTQTVVSDMKKWSLKIFGNW